MGCGAGASGPVVAVGLSTTGLPIAGILPCATIEEAQALVSERPCAVCLVSAELLDAGPSRVEAVQALGLLAPLVLVGVGAPASERGLFDLCLPSLEQARLDDILSEARARWRRCAEQRYRSAVDAVGQLAGGTAHDLNNVLTVVLGNLELMGFSMTDPSQRELLDAVDVAAEKGTEIARRLGAFSNRPEAPKSVPLNEVVRKAAAVSRKSLGEHTELHVRLSETAETQELLLRGDRMGGMLMNLIENARQAMPDGGSIILETSADPVPTEGPGCRVLRGAAVPARYLRVSVRDGGDGMSPDVLARCDELFYSGRARSRADGIGLSCATAYAAGEGGTLVVESAPGQGTSVHVLFPLDGSTGDS